MLSVGTSPARSGIDEGADTGLLGTATVGAGSGHNLHLALAWWRPRSEKVVLAIAITATRPQRVHWLANRSGLHCAAEPPSQGNPGQDLAISRLSSPLEK
jgi:hypothetical protein